MLTSTHVHTTHTHAHVRIHAYKTHKCTHVHTQARTPAYVHAHAYKAQMCTHKHAHMHMYAHMHIKHTSACTHMHMYAHAHKAYMWIHEHTVHTMHKGSNAHISTHAYACIQSTRVCTHSECSREKLTALPVRPPPAPGLLPGDAGDAGTPYQRHLDAQEGPSCRPWTMQRLPRSLCTFPSLFLSHCHRQDSWWTWKGDGEGDIAFGFGLGGTLSCSPLRMLLAVGFCRC